MALRVGDVFLLYCQTCSPPKPKYFVVALLHPFRCFLINSNLTAFQKAMPASLAANPAVLAVQHPFLAYDSYLGCDTIFAEYTEAEIVAVHVHDPRVYLGRINPATFSAMRAMFASNKLLPRAYIQPLINAWV